MSPPVGLEPTPGLASALAASRDHDYRSPLLGGIEHCHQPHSSAHSLTRSGLVSSGSDRPVMLACAGGSWRRSILTTVTALGESLRARRPDKRHCLCDLNP